MPTPDFLKLYTRKSNGNYYYVDAGGSVQNTPVKTALVVSPEDWKNISFSFTRNETLLGIFRKYSVPIGLVKSTAKILRHVYYNELHEGYCKIEIEQRNNNWTYDQIYSGEVDCSKIRDGRDHLTANIMELGIPALYDANKDSNYDIPTTGDPDLKTVVLDGMVLDGTYTFLVPKTQDTNGNPTLKPFTTGADVLDTFYMSEETFFALGDGGDALDITGLPSSEAFFKSLYSFNAIVRPRFQFFFHNNSATTAIQVRFKLLEIDDTGATLNSTTFLTSITCNPSANLTVYVGVFPGVPINIPVTLNKGRNLKIIFDFTPVTIAPNYQIVGDGQITVSGTFRMPSTTTLAFRFFDLFKKLVAKATNNTATAVSSFLTNPALISMKNSPWNTFVSPGVAVRGIGYPVFKTTLADCIKAAQVQWGLFFGIEGNNMILESIDYFLDSTTVIYDAGEVKNGENSSPSELLFNTIKVGYNDITYNEINGRNEFNSTQYYSTAGLRAVRELELICPYRADPYGIEYVRSRRFAATAGNKYKSDTTDDSADNDIFLLRCKATPVGGNYVLYRDAANPPTGVTDTAFNLDMTPKCILIRNMVFIRSCLPDGVTIKFESGLKNTEVAQGVGVNAVDEDGNLIANNFPRKFYPLVREFDGIIPASAYAALNANPRGRIAFHEYGTTYHGYLFDVTVKNVTKNSHAHRLLLASSNNIQKYIR